MKTLWNAIAVLAIANFVALLALTAWLWRQERLNPDRVERIRVMLAETAPEEEARLAEEQALAEEEAAMLEQEARENGVLPVSTQELLDERMQAVRLDRQRAERLRREVDDLKRTLTRERFAIDRDREQLRRDRAQFDALRRTIDEIEGSEQFQNALSVLRGLKPDAAKALLVEEISRGTTNEDGVDTGLLRVITYLDALPERQRTKVMNEFVQDDPPLAAQLLEGLRTKGLAPEDDDGGDQGAPGLAANQPAGN